MKRRVNEWLSFALVDLNAIIKLSEDELLLKPAAFHCQQCIEKSFKAIIEQIENKIPRTHDLIRLYGIINELGIDFKIDEDILSEISDVYIETRYPSDLGLLPTGNPTKEIIREFINTVTQIFNNCKHYLESI